MPHTLQLPARILIALILTTTLLTCSGCDALCRLFGLPTEVCNVVGRLNNRPIQDLRVTVEVQFIGVTDEFFERIGTDFDFNIDSDAPLLPVTNETPQLPGNLPQDSFLTRPVFVGGQQSSLTYVPRLLQADSVFLPAVQVNGNQPQADHFPGLPILSDLPVLPNIFSQPELNNLPGGAMVGSPANVDAFSVGFAILSDIEAFFFLQAAQSDTRNSILQAPKVTLFSGQPSFVVSRNEMTLIADVEPDFANALLAINPAITSVTSGPQLKVTPVVSADRRFIQLDIRPIIAAVGNADQVQVNGVDRLIQLPAIQTTTVQTSVSVPDGGTILLGGIKRMQGGQLERGVPILNKLPYINRLFKNVATIQDTQSLMLMVTPRIIIQEEVEE